MDTRHVSPCRARGQKSAAQWPVLAIYGIHAGVRRQQPSIRPCPRRRLFPFAHYGNGTRLHLPRMRTCCEPTVSYRTDYVRLSTQPGRRSPSTGFDRPPTPIRPTARPSAAMIGDPDVPGAIASGSAHYRQPPTPSVIRTGALGPLTVERQEPHRTGLHHRTDVQRRAAGNEIFICCHFWRERLTIRLAQDSQIRDGIDEEALCPDRRRSAQRAEEFGVGSLLEGRSGCAGGRCGKQCAAVTTSWNPRASMRKPRPLPALTMAFLAFASIASMSVLNVHSSLQRFYPLRE